MSTARSGRERTPPNASAGDSVRRRRAPSGPPPELVAAWCDDVARHLRAGLTLRHALLAALDSTSHDPAPGIRRNALDRRALRRELHVLASALRGGATVADAARRAATSTGAPLTTALAVIAAASDAGGSAAPAIDRAAAALRADAADRAERRAQASQARLSAIVMTTLPISVLGLLFATNPAVRVTVASPLGVGLVGTGGLLSFVGWRWMGRIIDGSRS